MARAARLDHATRQGQILEVAARVFCERGYEATSMGDVAAAVGMTKAGIYHHIAGKEDLLAAIMNYGMDLFEEKVLNRVMTIADPLERLKAALRGHVLLVIRDRPKEVTVILHETNALKGRFRDRINARKKRYIKFLEKTFREMIKSGAARRVDPSAAAFAMLGMINWIYQWYRPGGRLSDEAVADALSDVFLGGILARPPGPA